MRTVALFSTQGDEVARVVVDRSAERIEFDERSSDVEIGSFSLDGVFYPLIDPVLIRAGYAPRLRVYLETDDV